MVVQLFYTLLYFIYCKVAGSTRALSHVEGLKCNVMVPGPPKTGKEAWKGNMEAFIVEAFIVEAFILEASLTGGKDCIS